VTNESPRRIGLARVLSKLGYCSRSQAFALIRSGRVRLNGAMRRDPETPVRLGKDRIEIDGHALADNTKMYLMFNKPRGVVTTASDEKGRETVYAYLPEGTPWLSPVGRLDKASEGLLLFTNDSEWAAQVLAPETHLEKTYHVQVATVADEALAQAIVAGVRTADGEFLRAKSARILRRGEKNTWLEIVLEEGRNRHIRRMMQGLGVEVLRLVRVSIGPLRLGTLAKGASRPLNEAEKRAIDKALRQAPSRVN
jgi:23S rRNA pseudouridine2605 synthase